MTDTIMREVFFSEAVIYIQSSTFWVKHLKWGQVLRAQLTFGSHSCSIGTFPPAFLWEFWLPGLCCHSWKEAASWILQMVFWNNKKWGWERIEEAAEVCKVHWDFSAFSSCQVLHQQDFLCRMEQGIALGKCKLQGSSLPRMFSGCPWQWMSEYFHCKLAIIKKNQSQTNTSNSPLRELSIGDFVGFSEREENNFLMSGENTVPWRESDNPSTVLQCSPPTWDLKHSIKIPREFK